MLIIFGDRTPYETVEVNISASYMSEYEDHTIMIHIQGIWDVVN